jgi:hypothetical protein
MKKVYAFVIPSLLAFAAFRPFACGQAPSAPGINFIDYFFENGSPLTWENAGDNLTRIYLPADYERESYNRQTDHWYFKILADSGTHIRIAISKMQPDIYNGKAASDWWNFAKGIPCYISYDHETWIPLRTSSMPGHQLLADFVLSHDNVYLARLPVYTVSDLDKLESEFNGDPLFKVIRIGETVEKRPLEIIQLGSDDARFSVIIRARAHPWESGGNWIVEGLVRKFLSERSPEWEETYRVYIMPMANKDGVARGMTRFNVRGMDLNRKWDSMSDPSLCPEKYALEKFLDDLLSKGIKPSLGIDIHNDDAGSISPSTHKKDDPVFLNNMKLFEELMRKYTVFSEDVRYSWDTGGSREEFVLFENGLYRRYGIEAMVWELNANWIGNPGRIPLAGDWIKSGENLNEVFYRYLRDSE